MKFRFIYTFLILFFAYFFMSLSTGRTDPYAGHPSDFGTCSSCHSGGSSSGSISLIGAPISYVAGVTYPLTLTINSGTANVGGFQIVATDNSSNLQIGTFTTTPGETKLLTGGGTDDGRLVQSTPKSFSGGSVSWSCNWTAPSSGAPANVRFYFAGNAADGTGGTGDDFGFSGISAMIPLPVELSFFEVKTMQDEIVKLNWQTQSEENSDYFEIQRSRNEDGTEFESIGRIFSAGNSILVNDYEFEDRLPILNQFSYYRLKQVDLDGKFAFSNIQSVKIKGEGVVGVFPNPIKNNQTLNISYPNQNDLEKRVHIVNSMGAIVFESVLENQSGENIAVFDLPELPVGIYFVSVFENNNLIEVKKLLVQ